MTERKPSESLRAATQAVANVRGVLVIEGPTWDARENCWTLCVRIDAEEESPFVPRSTDWFVLVDDAYPRGRLEIFPSDEGGLTATFPHQVLNLKDSSRRWRSGKICVDAPGFTLSRWTPTGEPTSADRLRWHVERARGWVIAASEGSLRNDGDHFELPHIPEIGTPRIVFEEGPEHLATWQVTTCRHGHVEFREVPGGALAVTKWWCSSTTVRATTWGPRVARAPEGARGYWILLDAMPTVPPFRWPLTWGELLAQCGPEFMRLLQDVVARARPRASVLLLGFPIPDKVGAKPHEVHWTALQLGPFRVAKKVRDAATLWERDREGAFADDAPVRWLPTENWHPARLGSRGRLVESLRTRRIVLLGAGALGASVAELLVRGGVTDLTLVDGDHLIAPNLVRHTLTIDDHRSSKARALTERLNTVSPFASVKAIASMLSLDDATARELLAAFDLIIDCTANDNVIRVLGRVDFPSPKLFASAAVGRASRRLYFFEAEGQRFPAQSFWREADPWFLDERAEGMAATPFEGPGCWHPIFPAQATDLTMMAAVTVKRLERLAERGTRLRGELQVFEQAEDGDGFTRVQRVRRKQGA